MRATMVSTLAVGCAGASDGVQIGRAGGVFRGSDRAPCTCAVDRSLESFGETGVNIELRCSPPQRPALRRPARHRAARRRREPRGAAQEHDHRHVRNRGGHFHGAPGWATVEVASDANFAEGAVQTTNLPGLAVVSVPNNAGLLPDVHGVTVGATSADWFPATDPQITCTCDRSSNPACPCVYPGVPWRQTVIAADGATLDLFLLRDANGTRSLHARRFDMPVAVIPFGPEDVL